MTTDAFLVLRLIFTGLFIATLIAGVYLLRNYDRLFGPDPDMPSENDSARAYSKVQIFCIWAHVAGLTAAFALLLH